MEPHVLDHIKASGFFDIKEQLIPELRDVGAKVLGWTHEKFSSGAQTMDDYLAANFEFLKNYPLAKEYLRDYREIRKHVWVGRNADISPSAVLVRPIIIGHEALYVTNGNGLIEAASIARLLTGVCANPATGDREGICFPYQLNGLLELTL